MALTNVKVDKIGLQACIDTLDQAISDASDAALAAVEVSDVAYDATSWNGETATAPSKNSVRDKVVSIDAAIALKADASAVSNVDNTSDADKPVSTAQQTALDLKRDSAFTASVAADWDGGVSPATIQAALDQLAARLAILEP